MIYPMPPEPMPAVPPLPPAIVSPREPVTPARLQAVIDWLGDRGGVVQLPRGTIDFGGLTAPINITQGPVTIRGWGADETHHTANMAGTAFWAPGTLFRVSGQGARGTRFEGFSITQPPGNIPTSGVWNPPTQPHAIVVDGAGGEVSFRVHFPHAMNGIKVSGAGRVFFERVTGSFIDNGIELDQAHDKCYFGHVHMWPFYSAGVGPYTAAQGQRLTGLRIGRADGFHANSVFVFNANIGVQIGNLGAGISRHWAIDALYCDFCRFGLTISGGSPFGSAPGPVLGRIGSLVLQQEDYQQNGTGNVHPNAYPLHMSGGAVLTVDYLAVDDSALAGAYIGAGAALNVGRSLFLDGSKQTPGQQPAFAVEPGALLSLGHLPQMLVGHANVAGGGGSINYPAVQWVTHL